MNEIVVPPPPEDSSAWPSYIEGLLALTFPDGYQEEFEVYEATPRCIQIFLRVSEPFDENPSDAYQAPIEQLFRAERDDLAAALDERWGTRCASDTDSADFSAALLEYLQAWPVYAWAHGDRVVLLGLQKTEREHPFELCVAVARRWTDSAPADEALWPLFVRQLCDRSPATADAFVVPLWEGREKPASLREREYLREDFADLQQNLRAELAAVWGPPLALRPEGEDPVTPALNGLGIPSRESPDVWQRGNRFVATGVTTNHDTSLTLFAAVLPQPSAL